MRDLERNHFPRSAIGIAIPALAPTQPGASAGAKISGRRAKPRAPPALFPGWTSGMAPWSLAETGPVTVLGSLSLTHPRQRPRDLREFGSALGLSAEAILDLREGFERHEVLVSVEAVEKASAAAHVLERNGGRLLLPKQD